MKIKVAIVDDHFAVREGYRMFLQKQEYVGSVEIYTGATDFWAAFAYHEFEMVLLDIDLKDGNGLDICKQLKQTHPLVKVIMVSSYHNRSFILNAFENNADGFIFKDSDTTELKTTFNKVVAGERFFNPEAMAMINNEKKLIKGLGKIHFSDKELDVMKLICEGKSNKEIGVLMYKSEATVSTHKQNIMKKIGAHKSHEILVYAISEGIYLPVKKS